MYQRPLRCLVTAVGLLVSVGLSLAENVNLATTAIPQKTIVIPNNSGTAMQALATELAGFLTRITTGTFVTGTFNPTVGPNGGTIVLAKASDLNLSDDIPATDPKKNEQYLIASANSGSYVVIAGATDLAVSDGVFDWLEKMGCRWFFPTAKWEILPSNTNLSWVTPATALRTKTVLTGSKTLDLNIYHEEIPDYNARYIWFPYNSHAGGKAPYGEWMQQWTEFLSWSRRNRNTEGLRIRNNHNYVSIANWAKAQNPSRWKPEYAALINGVRGNADPQIDRAYQFCVSNPEVVQLCQDFALDWFADHPDEDSVSMEPNDGVYWCECVDCEAIQSISSGFVTDRVLHIANAVADVIPADKFVGILAYSKHSGPPTNATVDDKIYVNIATGYLSYGYTFEELLSEWGNVAENVGVYDYFSSFLYDIGLPLRSDGSDLEYLRESFPAWHTTHADSYNAQSTYSYGMLGLGHYLALKILWNVGADVDALREDFLTKCFGAAAGTMDEFYRRIDNGEGYRLSTDLIGRLYGFLDTAYGETSDPKVLARLDDLTLWVRYCELRRNFDKQPVGNRQDEAEETLRFAWKIRATSMLDTLSLWRMVAIWGNDNDNPAKDEFAWPLNTVTWPHVWSGTGQIYVSYPPGQYELDWSQPMVASGSNAPEGHPWKESSTFSHGDILDMVADGTANNPLLAEEPRSFGTELVPSGLPAKTRGTLTGYRSKVFSFYLRSSGSGVLPSMDMSTGWVANKGPIVYTLYTADGETALQSGEVPADKVNYTVSFNTVAPNTSYLLVCDDSSSYSKVSWASGAKITMLADSDYPYNQNGGVSYRYFYVPKGTQNVLAYAYSIGTCNFYNASGTIKHMQPAVSNGVDITIPVAAGEDDTVWYVRTLLGKDIFFQNIPGLMAASPDELLIPKDALIDLLPSGASSSTRGTFLKMYTKNAFYIRGDSGGTLPSFSISNGWSSQAFGDAEWTLYTEDGKTALETGVVPPNQLTYTVSFTTSSTRNTYLLVYDDKKGNSEITWDAGKRVSIAADAKYPHTQSGGVSRRYFFVPKGTTNVTYKAEAMLACDFYNAAGTLRHAQAASGSHVDDGFTVPSGEDDQFWYITGFGGTEFEFVNIPGLLGANPNEMLIPHWTFLD